MSILHVENKYFMTNAVEIQKQRLNCPQESHYHDFVEIIYMIRGKCTHTINDVEYPVSHGDMLIVNYNQMHSISGNPSAEYINILMKPEFISNNLTQPENAFSLLDLAEFEDFSKIVDESNCVISFSGEARSALETLIFSMKREIKEQAPGWELALRSSLNMLLITIFRKMALPMRHVGSGGINDELLGYIRAHCHEKLTLKKLAEYSYYNPAYFSRLFKQYTDMTLTEYLKTVRIEKACQLLIHTDARIADIFLEVGYSDKTKFFRDFKSIMEVSPLEYRKSKK